MRIWITSDTHESFERIAAFCEKNKTSKEDLLIITGDAGINYHGYVKDRRKKEYLEALPIRLLCVHGNHEMRPEKLLYYKEEKWCGGIVYVEKEFPSILFAKDGEIYELLGKKVLVIGGAYSIDRLVRNYWNWNWWPDEQPSEETKAYVEEQLEKYDWKVHIVLSHTCPLKYEPKEFFLDYYDQSDVDKSTEDWLDTIEERLSYEDWYCGHFHGEKEIDKLHFMYKNYLEVKSK